MIRLGAFTLEEPLATGGMATVWRGRHVEQGVPVAVKVLSPGLAQESNFVHNLHNEVRASARLDHPHIVPVLDYGQVGEAAANASGGRLSPDSPYVVMEFIDGPTLGKVTPLPWPELSRILLELLDALAHAHARGVVHLDLKPDNVLLRGGTDVILTDFGIAATLEGARRVSAYHLKEESPSAAAGTPAFMAPEQFVGDRRGLGPWTDLYGLGCLVWYLLTGKTPFPYQDFFQLLHAHRSEPLPPLELEDDVPPALEGWLHRLMKKAPGDRFQQAADAAWALMNLPTEEEGGQETLRVLPGAQAVTLQALTTPDQMLATVQIGVAGGLSPSRSTPPLPESWRQVEPTRRSLQLMGAGLNLYGLRTTPFVGRESERDTLWQALRQVHTTRQAHVVIVQGAAGTGKSRLVEWLCDRSSELGSATVMKAVHSTSGGPAEGIAPMLVRHLRLSGLTPAEMQVHLRATLQLDAIYDNLELSALGQLLGNLGGDVDNPQANRGGAEENFSLLRRVLERLAEQRPLILWLEDASWAAESLAFIHHLMSRRDWSPFPVLVVITSQDESQQERPVESALLGALASQEEVCTLQLPAFTRQEQVALVCSLLPLELPLAEKVVSRTAGNPLFATQLVGDWVQRGLLVPGPRGFRLKDSRRTTLPDDLHQMWQTHLGRLCEGEPPTSIISLEVLAALGQTVDEGEWRGVCQEAALPCSDRLVQRMLTQRMLVPVDNRGSSEKQAWGFSHTMLRESLARTAIEGGRWESHHQRCAAVLARIYPRNTRGVEERIGQHLLAAGQVVEALAPLLAAARAHYLHHDLDRAVVLWDLRQRRVVALGMGPADRAWAEGMLLRAFIHLERGEPELGLRLGEQLEYAARAAGWKDLEGIALMHHANCMRWQGNYTSAGLYYQKALALLKQTKEQGHATYCLRGLGNIAYQQGNLPRALELYKSALERNRSLGDTRHIVYTLSFLGHLYREMGDLDKAEQGLKEALELAERHHLLFGLADIHRNLGLLALFNRKNLPLAERHLTYSFSLYDRLGQRRPQAELANDMGELSRRRGEGDEAERWYRRSLELARSAQAGLTECTEFNLSCLLVNQGRYGEVTTLLEGRPEALLATGRKRFVNSMRLAQLVSNLGLSRISAAEVSLQQIERGGGTSEVVDEDDLLLVEHISRLVGEKAPELALRWRELDTNLRGKNLSG